MAIVGAVIAVVFGFLWIRDVTRPVHPRSDIEPERREERVEISPGETTSRPNTRAARSSPSPHRPRSRDRRPDAVPVLGFAVLPSFTNQEEQDVELGPIDEFPEGQFVIATYLEDPEVGEVTRRTMYIRNNGIEDGVPSFTLLYSRCAHLGCPVQPNSLIFEEEKKVVGEQGVELTIAVTGFNAVSRQPVRHRGEQAGRSARVRALDRAEFSIKDVELYLGRILLGRRGGGAGGPRSDL